MSRKDELTINDLLPLAPALFHMLLILSEGERHGYALKREIARRTGGKINLARVFCMDRSTRCWSRD